MAAPLRWMATRLIESTGRGYEIDPAIPSRFLAGEVLRRGFQLLRGLLRTGRPIFLDSRVRLRGVRRRSLARGVSIGAGSILDARGSRGLVMASASRLGHYGILTTTSHLSLYGVGLELGQGSGIGDFFHIGGSGGVTIGRNVIIGPHLLIHSQEHEFADATRPIREQGTQQKEVFISDDCWIGSRVTLLAGTYLGPRTVVAAGSVVKGRHEGNEILAGTPARSIRSL